MSILYSILPILLSLSSLKAEDVDSFNVAADTTITDLIFDLILSHEMIRTEHVVDPLVWDDMLMNMARDRALQRAKYHGSGKQLDELEDDLGENWNYTADEGKAIGAAEGIKAWYFTQKELYDFDNPMVNSSNMNFAQITSKTSKYFGCSQASSSNQTGDTGFYLVCLYYPRYIPGNEKDNIFSQPNFESIIPLFGMVSQAKGCENITDFEKCTDSIFQKALDSIVTI